MAQAVGITLVGLLAQGKQAQADKLNLRQSKFQQRAASAHAMPLDGKVYAHECRCEGTDKLVAAGMCDGSGHVLLVNGKQYGTTHATQTACKAAYWQYRAVMYYAHSLQCTPAKVKVRATVQQANGYTPKLTVATQSGKVAKLGKGKGASK